jgi:fatty-acyl-CoA synthase
VGRPSDRFGEEVVAVVQLRDGASLDPAGVREFAAQSLARFKAPRAVAVCDRVPRHANGKADYGRARAVAATAVDAVGVSASATAGAGPTRSAPAPP